MVNRMTIHLRAYSVSRGYRITLARTGTQWDASQKWPRFAHITEGTYPEGLDSGYQYPDEEYALAGVEQLRDDDVNGDADIENDDERLEGFNREIFDDVGFGAYA